MKRRRVLAALGGTGLAAFAGLGIGTKGAVQYTTAQSTETCPDVTLEAEWRETYTSDGQTVLLENNSAENSTATLTPTGPPAGTQGGDPAIISLDNVLPGDRGTIGFKLIVTEGDDTVTPTLSIDLVETLENGVNDPEREARDNSSGDGELDEFIEVRAWEDTGVLGFDALGAENLASDPLESELTDDGFQALSDVSVTNEELGTIGEGDSVAVTLRWRFNPDASPDPVNVTQTDSVTFTLDIGCTS